MCQFVTLSGVFFVYGLVAAKDAYGKDGSEYRTYRITLTETVSKASLEKMIKDNGDKLPEDDKSKRNEIQKRVPRPGIPFTQFINPKIHYA